MEMRGDFLRMAAGGAALAAIAPKALIASDTIPPCTGAGIHDVTIHGLVFRGLNFSVPGHLFEANYLKRTLSVSHRDMSGIWELRLDDIQAARRIFCMDWTFSPWRVYDPNPMIHRDLQRGKGWLKISPHRMDLRFGDSIREDSVEFWIEDPRLCWLFEQDPLG
jgi:hypothetical protein